MFAQVLQSYLVLALPDVDLGDGGAVGHLLVASGLGVHEWPQLGHPSFADEDDPGWSDDAMHHVLLPGEGHRHVDGPLLLVEQ